jgi:hypothetical protein
MTSSTGGYRCAGCGQWVSPGDTHSCTIVTPVSGSYSFVYPDTALLERIAKALETIADHLSKMH